MSATKIEWATDTVNPTAGCTRISAGCDNCYACRQAYRLAAMGQAKYQGLTEKRNGRIEWTGKIGFDLKALDSLRRCRKPRRVFIDSMGDLFHDDVPQEAIFAIYAAMMQCPQHAFLVLTKRISRAQLLLRLMAATLSGPLKWPPRNVWLGVTAENQKAWEERRKHLRDSPAALRFLSYEPALGPLELSDEDLRWLGCVLCGGETGPGARPMDPDWPRKVRDDCVAAGVPYFFKHWGEWAHESSLGVKVFRSDKGGYAVAGFEGLSKVPAKGTRLHQWPDGSWSCRVGKKAAGRLLDGKEWNETPQNPT